MDVEDGDGTDREHFKPEDVIAHRSGDVLIKQTVLKADHFPSTTKALIFIGV